MIPEIFRDNTTIIKNHPVENHLFCVFIRSLLGILIITNKINKTLILIICVFIVLGFLNKYFKLKNVWKVYMRTIFVYSIVLVLTLLYGDKYNIISGTLIIVDGLMGMQSRYIFDKMSLLQKN
jgi:hypothetical protein